jgi:hypothetical protein
MSPSSVHHALTYGSKILNLTRGVDHVAFCTQNQTFKSDKNQFGGAWGDGTLSQKTATDLAEHDRGLRYREEIQSLNQLQPES